MLASALFPSKYFLQKEERFKQFIDELESNSISILDRNEMFRVNKEFYENISVSSSFSLPAKGIISRSNLLSYVYDIILKIMTENPVALSEIKNRNTLALCSVANMVYNTFVLINNGRVNFGEPLKVKSSFISLTDEESCIRIIQNFKVFFLNEGDLFDFAHDNPREDYKDFIYKMATYVLDKFFDNKLLMNEYLSRKENSEKLEYLNNIQYALENKELSYKSLSQIYEILQNKR